MNKLGDDPKVGSVIDFHILRDGKVIHEYKKLHNFMVNLRLSDYRMDVSFTYGALRAYDRNSWIKMPTSSTYRQDGTSITRVSGSDSLSSNSDGLWVWPGNIIGGYTVSALAAQVTVTNSQTVLPTNQLVLIETKDPSSWTVKQTVSHVSGGMNFISAATYLNGVITKTTEPAIRDFPVVTVPYTLRSLVWGNQLVFDLPEPIPLIAGDQIIVTGITFTLTYTQVGPETFASGAFAGLPIPSGGSYQKLLNSDLDFKLGNGIIDPTVSQNRIFLVTTGDATTIPNKRGPQLTPAGTLTSTINPTQTLITNAVLAPLTGTRAQGFTKSIEASAITTGPITSVKQIYFGNTSYLYSVFEFDQAQDFADNCVITLTNKTTMTQDLPLNDMFA